MDPYNQALQWYTMSQRKEITFRKIYESRSLTLEQVDRLQTAESLYECVPLAIYAPFSIYLLRLVGRANNKSRLLSLIA